MPILYNLVVEPVYVTRNNNLYNHWFAEEQSMKIALELSTDDVIMRTCILY